MAMVVFSGGEDIADGNIERSKECCRAEENS